MQKNILQLLLTTCLLMCVNLSFCQSETELLTTINSTKNDSIKCTALNSLSLLLCNTKNDKAIVYANTAKDIAEKIKNLSLKQTSYLSIAICNDVKNDLLTATTFYYKAFAIAIQKKDLPFLASAYHELGYTYMNKNILDSSLFYYLQAIEIRKKIADSINLVESYNGAAIVHRKMNNYSIAIELYNKCFAINEKIKDEQGLMIVSRNIAALYRNQKKYDSAFLFYKKALPIAKKLNIESEVNIIQLNTALCYNDVKQYTKALYILTEVAAKISNANNQYPLLILGLGEANVGVKNYAEGIKYLIKAASLEYKQSNFEYAGTANKLLAQAYQQTNNYSLALQYFKQYKMYSDSQYAESKSRNINELSTQYKTKEKEQEIVLLNKENQLKDLSIKEKQRTNLLYVLGLGLVSIVALGIFLLYKNKQKFSNQLEDKNKIISVSLKEKEVLLKEIHHRVKNNLQVISSLLNLQSKNISDEKALKALNEGRNRVKSMALIHQNLYRDDNLMGVDVQEYIEKLTQSLFASYNIEPNKIKLLTNIDKIELDVDTVIPLGLILNELVSNALKYAFENTANGVLQVDLKLQHNKLLLRVKDNGKGMDKDALATSKSMGYKLIQSFLQKLHATMNIEVENGTNIELLIEKYKLVDNG